MHTAKRLTIAYLSMAGALLALFALNLFWGSVALTPRAVAAALLGRGQDALAGSIVWQLRLPRAVMAALLGAALSAAGYLLQTFFCKSHRRAVRYGHLKRCQAGGGADDGGIFLNRGLLTSSLTLILAAFAGALAAMAFVLAVARRVQRMSILVICGVMIGYICSAVTDIVVAFAQDSNIVNLHNWSMGSFSGVTWGKWRPRPLLYCPVWGRVSALKPMAAYQMGEAYARSVGVPVRAFSATLVLLSSLLAACVTAFAGPISFVGIAVPHLVRQALGSARPLYVLPGCALGGATFCLLCDLIARSLFAPTELSISSVTAVFGAPIVIWLLVRRHSREGAV